LKHRGTEEAEVFGVVRRVEKSLQVARVLSVSNIEQRSRSQIGLEASQLTENKEHLFLMGIPIDKSTGIKGEWKALR
jgi:hypothetical protein